MSSCIFYILLPSLLTWPWVNAFPLKTPRPSWKTVTGAARYAELRLSLIVGAVGGTGVVGKCRACHIHHSLEKFTFACRNNNLFLYNHKVGDERVHRSV